MGLMGLMGIISCDKIDPADYTVYDGAAITWTTGQPILNPVQRAYVEKYTGPQCRACPKADSTLNVAYKTYGDDLVLVSINYPSGQGKPFPGEPDMRTDGGNLWSSYFVGNTIPAARLNRDRSSEPFTGSMDNIVPAIAQALSPIPSVAVDMNAVRSDNDNVNVDITLNFLQDFSDPLTLTVLVTEDSLIYKQDSANVTINNYVHNHMLRKVITGFWGRELPSTTSNGTMLSGTLRFKPADDLNLEHCHIVAFLSYKSSRRVINSASCPIQ